MTNIEKNTVIAKFMGVYPKYDAQADCYYYIDSPWIYSRGTLEEVTKHINEYVKYYTSWDWLIPVCRKLLLHFDGDDFEYIHETLRDVLPSCDISIVYDTCVEFILEINKDKDNDKS